MRSLTPWLIDAGQLLLILAVPIIAVGIGVMAWRLRRESVGAVDRTVRDVAVALALAVVVVATLLIRSPGLGPDVPVHVKWLPFDDLLDALRGSGRLRLTIIEMVSNVVLFVPLGMALRWQNPRLGLGRIAMIAAVVSIGVELIQGLVLTDRWPSTTDVIMNGLGGLVGAAIAGSLARAPAEER